MGRFTALHEKRAEESLCIVTEERIEKDGLGEKAIPADAMWGIHTARAVENFPVSGRPVNRDLVHSYGAVKLACARANHDMGLWDEDTFTAVSDACHEMMNGALDDHIVVDALQGGAGTSTNMNVNEVLANSALLKLDRKPGDYDTVHPINDINLHQSTNDTFPTALRVAAIRKLRELEKALVDLLEAFQEKEKEMAHVVRVGRTQMQDAVLTTMGRTMSAYAEAFGRDRWRVYKCEERLRVVNLGGTAIGTGLTAPRKYIFSVVDNLKAITGLGLARAENLVEATQNQDALVEVSGILSACAANLMKTGNDLRFMSCGPNAGIGELSLPARQAGSSVMPGKVNPVIPEAAVQAAIAVMANHQAISQACGMGHLELNAFLPLVADRLLESLDILAATCSTLSNLCVRKMKVDEDVCAKHVNGATAVVTALLDVLGYEVATDVANESAQTGKTVREIVTGRGLLDEDQFDRMVSAESVMRLGSSPPRDLDRDNGGNK